MLPSTPQMSPPPPVDSLAPTVRRRVDPIVIYTGNGDMRGAELAAFLRSQGCPVLVRDTTRDPTAATALRSLLAERGEAPDLPFPIIDFHVNNLRPISWPSTVEHFRGVMWNWLPGVLRHAQGETATEEALPVASTARSAALARLRTPSASLPASADPLFGGHAERPLVSALDQIMGAGANLSEGFMRTLRGTGGGRQALSGLVQAPFALAALPVAALETASAAAFDGLLGAYRDAHGMIAALLAIVVALAALVLLPLRAASFLLGTLVFRPLALAGQWLAERIAGDDFGRVAVNVLPTELSDPSGRSGILATERANDTNPGLADPETWIAYFSSTAHSNYSLPPPLIRELTALRRDDRAAYDRLRAELADAGVQCFYRFPSLALLQRALRDRDVVDDRPIALVIATPHDHNSSFMSLATTLSQLDQGHRLVYVEAIDDAEIAAAIARYGSQHPIATLVLAGHGEPTVASFSNSDGAMSGRSTLDIFDDRRFATLRPFLADHANVVLESCSTGRTREGGENLAQMLQRIWPQTTVSAPTAPDRNAGYSLDARGRVLRSSTVLGSARRFGR